MIRSPEASELAEIIARYSLPDMPGNTFDDDREARDLILYRQDDENLRIAEWVSHADARRYASREDVHGDGWFVGFVRS